MDSLVREVTGAQSCFVPLPRAKPEDSGDTMIYPTVLDCGAGSGIWIDKVLDEQEGKVDVKFTVLDRFACV